MEIVGVLKFIDQHGTDIVCYSTKGIGNQAIQKQSFQTRKIRVVMSLQVSEIVSHCCRKDSLSQSDPSECRQIKTIMPYTFGEAKRDANF